MRKIIFLAVAVLTLGLYSCAQQTKTKDQKTADGIIRVETPERPAGQKDVIALRCAPLDTVRVGFIGLGMRGPGAVERFTYIPGTSIKALCDLLPERVAESQKILEKRNLNWSTRQKKPGSTA